MAHIPRLYVRGHLGPGVLLLDAEQSKRLGTVMRLRPGDEFRVFSGDGREWQARVTDVARGRVHADVTELVRQEPPAAVVLEVWCALIRPARFDWAVEKCTEAGADIIRPLLTEHTARGDGTSPAKRERWARIAIEAAEQCGRLHVPVVEPPAQFADLLARKRGTIIVGDAAGKPWLESVPLLPARGTVAVAVGPEGGFSADEVARARAAGALLVRFGRDTFRTETAAVAGCALLRSSAG